MANKIRLEKDPLTPALLQKAEKELRETPEVRDQALQELRALLKAEPNLHFKDSDEVLCWYLRPNKFYAQSALALMKRIAEFRKKHGDALNGLLPSQLQTTMCDHSVLNVLVDRDQDGRRILVVHCGEKWNPSKITNEQLFQALYVIHQGALLEPATQVNGVVVMLDFKGLGMKQVAAFTPSFSMRLLSFIQEAMPLRLKQVHIVNQPFVFNMVWQIFKPLVQAKLNKRLFFIGTKWSDLHKHIDPSYLPEDYGGKLPKIDYSSKDWYPEMLALENIIKENNTFGFK